MPGGSLETKLQDAAEVSGMERWAWQATEDAAAVQLSQAVITEALKTAFAYLFISEVVQKRQRGRQRGRKGRRERKRG